MSGWAHSDFSLRVLARQVPSFAVVGALRTLASLFMYWGLNLLLPYWISFTVAVAASLLLSVFLSSRYVFLTRVSRVNAAAYALAYAANYGMSLGLLLIVVEILGVPPNLAPVIVIPVMFPLNFLTERWALGLAQ